MATPAIRRIVIEAYNNGSQRVSDANGALLHRPNSLEQVAAQDDNVKALEAAVRTLRAAVDAARESL